MKRICLIIILISSWIISTGQSIANYKPIGFNDFEPVWSHAVYDSTIVGHEIDHPSLNFGFDGYSHLWGNAQNNIFEPIIDEGYLYNLNKTIYRNDLSGALIEKVDLETGKSIWKSTFDGRDGIRETVEKAILKDDTLVLYNILITTPEPELPILPALAWGLGDGGGVLAIRKYDIETGELIDYTTANESNSNVKFLMPYAGGRNLLEPIGDNMLLSINSIFNRSGEGYFMVIDTLNFLGEYINETDTILSSFDIDWQLVENTNTYKILFDDESKDIYWIDYYNLYDENGEYIESKVSLKLLSEETTLTFDLDFLEANKYQFFGLTSLSEDYILLYANSTEMDNKRYFLLDRLGKLEESFQVNDNISIEDYMNLNGKGNFLFGNSIGSSGDYGFELIKARNSEITQVVQFDSSEPYYYSYLQKIVELDDGDFLLFFIQFDDSPNSTQQGRFFSVLRATPEMLNLVTSVYQVDQFEKNEVILFPNPTRKSFKLMSSEVIENIMIVDASGNKVQFFENYNLKDDINVSQLEDGMYYLVLGHNDGTLGFSQFVKSN